MSIQPIKLGKYDKLFSYITKELGYPKIVKTIYNFSIMSRIPKKVENTRVYTSPNTYVTYRNVRAQRPTNGRHGDINPLEILHTTGSSYMADVVGDIVRISETDGTEIILDKLQDVVLFRLPLMLDSEICKLHGKTPEELVEMGECIADPFGYFRIKSSEKLIIIQEQLRLCRIFIFIEKGEIDCRITVPCRKNTLVTNLIVGKEYQTIKIQLGHTFKDCQLPVYAIHYLLQRMTANQTTGQILQFIQPEYHEQAIMLLSASIQELESFEAGVEEKPLDSRLYTYIAAKFKAKSGSNLDQDKIISLIQDNLNPNIMTGIPDKLLQLSLMIARLLQYLMGIRPLDNRDSWSNKRLETPGRQIEKLFTIMWDQFITAKDFNKETALTDFQATSSYNIGDNFITAFAPGAWGPPRANKKENIVDSLKRTTSLEVIQQITKLNTPTSGESKAVTLREVSGSQVGYSDPAETIEGPRIGLVKNSSLTAQTSRELDPIDIINILSQQQYYYKIYDDLHRCPILVNGIISGWVLDEKVQEYSINLRSLRRKGIIAYDVCIYYNKACHQIEIYCDTSRPVRPILVVDEELQELVIEQKNGFNFTMEEMLNTGCLEYLDAQEQEFLFLCPSPGEFFIFSKKRKALTALLDSDQGTEEQRNQWFKDIQNIPLYTHCEFSPLTQFSIMSSLAPKANHQQGPRTSFQANMGRQALGPFHWAHEQRFDTGYKVSLRPSRPLFDVQTGELVKLEQMPITTSLVIAFRADKYNQEDGISMNEDVLHKFKLYKYETLKYIIQQGNLSGANEQIKFPQVDPSELYKYHALDPATGYPLPGKTVKNGDVILGKIRQDDYNSISNQSIRITEMDEGTIDRVMIEELSSQIIIKIKIRNLRKYIEGDKTAARYSQKGVISKITPSKDMPVIIGGPNDGVVPDLVISSMAIISRMTQGFLIEPLASKASLYCGERVNGTSYAPIFNHPEPEEEEYSNPEERLIALRDKVSDAINEEINRLLQGEFTPTFESRDHIQSLVMKDIERMGSVLENNGMSPDGCEVMITKDGTIISSTVNVGIIAYMLMRQHVKDKFQARGTGTNQIQTHQPVAGRSKHGGIRFGEMERDSQLSMGSSASLRESLFLRSDAYELPLCVKCGIPPTYYHSHSQSAPIYQCKKCRENQMCLVQIPCAQKYLAQVVAGMGIEIAYDVKLINEDKRLLL